MRRHPSLLVGAAAASLLLTACTGGSPDSSAGGDGENSGTLRYLIEDLEDAEALSLLEDHLADFTEESGIEVEVEQLDIDTMRTVLQTQLRSEEGPDVFAWGSGPSSGGALADAGLLYDLTDAYEEHGWEVYDFARERVTYDGIVYGQAVLQRRRLRRAGRRAAADARRPPRGVRGRPRGRLHPHGLRRRRGVARQPSAEHGAVECCRRRRHGCPAVRRGVLGVP
jgi:hypothetical protein